MMIIPLFFIIPLLSIFFIAAFTREKSWLANLAAVLVAAVLLILSLMLALFTGGGKVLCYNMGGFSFPVSIMLVADSLAVFMLLIVYCISLLTLIYSKGYMQSYLDKWKYYILFLSMLVGVNGVLLSGDIVTLYIFLEVSGVSSYALVCFTKKANAFVGAFRYMIKGVLASSIILFGIALCYSYLSALNLADIAQQLIIRHETAQIQMREDIVILFILGFFSVGFGLKTGIFPFHRGVIEAYTAAEAPVAAMLSGVVIPVIGLYAFIRLFFCVIGVFPAGMTLLLAMGILSFSAGIIKALREHDFRKIIAGHLVSELGLVVFAFGLGTQNGLLGAITQMVNYIIISTLFCYTSGMVSYAINSNHTGRAYAQIKNIMVARVAVFTAALALCGVFPFSGFWSKFIIMIEAKKVGNGQWFFLLALFYLLAFISSIRILKKFIFTGKKGDAFYKPLKIKIPFSMNFPVGILACISIGAYIIWFFYAKEMFFIPAINVLNEGTLYAQNIFLGIK
ncbi:MAG: hypothetical protein HY810_09445 [Candidatus Omnitrophica bacterium]|nr:hypothetical protein [Candidatus Omnitrophota bacterium]